MDEVVLHLPRSADAELHAVAALDRLLAGHPVEERAAGQARIALLEACLNALEYSAPSPKPVDVTMALEAGELKITVGNPGAIRPRQSSPFRGHGLRIIQNFMDRVQFRTDASGTRVEMTKRVSSGNPGAN
jgi:anti-sigma regulatory factor (Ser/Thr protein kinase)